MLSKTKVRGFFYLALGSVLFASVALAQESVVEPEADKIFKQMSVYLDGLDKFTVKGHTTIETMLDSGQKIMLDHVISNSINRPDKFFSTRRGDSVEQSFYYDGKTFTLYNHHPHRYYATVDAPDNLSDALNVAIKKFNLVAPGADLIYKNSYARLSNGLISGFYVGKKTIDGVECHHLAFRNTEVDWQIWIQTGDKPLPKRYVITSRWITGSPQYRIDMKWNIHADFADDMFTFIVPDNAEKIELLSTLPVNRIEQKESR